MKNECFLDTNILIYAAAARNDIDRKYQIAEQIILNADFCLSSQVLAEFYVNSQKKLRVPPTLPDFEDWINLLSQFPILPVDADVVRSGIANSRRYRISYWDGAIIAAAERLDAPVIYSEDMNHGQKYGAVTVINPFRAR